MQILVRNPAILASLVPSEDYEYPYGNSITLEMEGPNGTQEFEFLQRVIRWHERPCYDRWIWREIVEGIPQRTHTQVQQIMQRHFHLRKEMLEGNVALKVPEGTEIKAFLCTPGAGGKSLRVNHYQEPTTNESMLRVTSSGTSHGTYQKYYLCPQCFSHAAIHRCQIDILNQYNDSKLFGKICNHCRKALDDWLQCKYCKAVYWPESESHWCDELTKRVEKNPTILSDNADYSFVTKFKTHPIAG